MRQPATNSMDKSYEAQALTGQPKNGMPILESESRGPMFNKRNDFLITLLCNETGINFRISDKYCHVAKA